MVHLPLNQFLIMKQYYLQNFEPLFQFQKAAVDVLYGTQNFVIQRLSLRMTEVLNPSTGYAGYLCLVIFFLIFSEYFREFVSRVKIIENWLNAFLECAMQVQKFLFSMFCIILGEIYEYLVC